ncbi:AAA family ATPase [Vibrio gazogenes]|uniref:AAA family ATPase n=1 Tax=Vibrio gazogenes TaxID=687 RepID=A0A1Z2SK05_VIBGA|nr:ATP-binding protein [Vibrio gazogenes]ASA57465.1 AAA family ATPase [Vibrio gazogenes]
MTKIYATCGFIGSGKTTYAKTLAEKCGAFRFSIDEWMLPLYGEHMERDVFDHRLSTLKGLFEEAALQLFALGTPVIFDFGLWTRTERQAFSHWASSIGVDYQIHYLDVSFDICKQRALARNSEREEKSYEMTPEMLDLFWSRFEVPSPEENVVWVQTTT